MSTSSLILQSYLKTNAYEDMDKLRYEEKVLELLEYNHSIQGDGFLTPLSFYLDILENTDEVFISYMNKANKTALLRDLQAGYLLLLAQVKYESDRQKIHNFPKYWEQVQKYQRLIDAIQYQQYCKQHKKPNLPYKLDGVEGRPVAYLGLPFGEMFAKHMVKCTDSKSNTIRDMMNALNEKRLYWVWGSSLLKTTLAVLPEDFFNLNQAKKAVVTPDPYTGYTSFILYYMRFALNLNLLLKHTISGPWMSAEEKRMPWTQRFKTQWAQRKFFLLNDSIWGIGNMVCFLWLCGKGLAGTFGDVLTLGLLVFDISLTVWDFAEQKTNYNKEIKAYAADIILLEKQIEAAKLDISEHNLQAYKNHLSELERQLATLKDARRNCERKWQTQKILLVSGIIYAIGLMAAFFLLASPFFPFAATTVMACVITGAVLCFAFTVINNAIRGGVELHNSKASIKENKEHYVFKVKELKSLITQNPDLEDNEKKLLFLDIKKLLAQNVYQEKQVTKQTLCLLRSMTLEALFPALMFASFVFFPLAIGLATLGATLALAIGTHLLIENKFTGKKPEEIKSFDEDEYHSFCKSLKQQPHSGLGFFQHTTGDNVSLLDKTNHPTDNSSYS